MNLHLRQFTSLPLLVTLASRVSFYFPRKINVLEKLNKSLSQGTLDYASKLNNNISWPN